MNTFISSNVYYEADIISFATRELYKHNSSCISFSSKSEFDDLIKNYLWNKGKSIPVVDFDQRFIICKNCPLGENVLSNKLIKIYESPNFQMEKVLIELSHIKSLLRVFQPNKVSIVSKYFKKYTRYILEDEIPFIYQKLENHYSFMASFFNFFLGTTIDQEFYAAHLEELLKMDDHDKYAFLIKTFDIDDQPKIQYLNIENDRNFTKKIITTSYVLARHWQSVNPDYKIIICTKDYLEVLYYEGGYFVDNCKCIVPINHWDFLNNYSNDLIVISDVIVISKKRNWKIKKLLNSYDFNYTLIKDINNIYFSKLL